MLGWPHKKARKITRRGKTKKEEEAENQSGKCAEVVAALGAFLGLDYGEKNKEPWACIAIKVQGTKLRARMRCGIISEKS